MLVLLALLSCTDKDLDSGTTPWTDDTGGGAVAQEGCEARHDAFVAALAADLQASEAPGVSAAIMEGGAITCRVAMGTKAPDSVEPVGLETLFQLGSTTKMFTALALLQAVEDGRLGLETSLAEAYPDSEFGYDEGWNDAVTMHHLLTHQGAFYDYYDVNAGSRDDTLVTWHEEVFFPYLWLMAPPGSFWNYSNPNFDLAGLVVEHLDPEGRYYPDLMAQEVFSPLGMTRTYLRKAEAEADGDYAIGVGYQVGPAGGLSWGTVELEEVADVASARPAGAGTWSTPDQVLAMARFLVEGDGAVLDDGLRQAMTAAQVDLGYGDTLGSYGYGVFVSPGFYLGGDYYLEPLWDHGGNTLSYSSELYIVPGQGFAVSVLSSGYGTDFSGAVAAALSDLVVLPEPTEVPAPEVDPERLDLHLGSYDDAYNVGAIEISRVDSTLHVAMPFLEELGYTVQDELVPYSSDLWYLYIDGVPYDLTFLGSDGDSASQWVRNRAFVGTRVEDGPVSVAPPRSGPQVPRLPGPALGPPPRRALVAPRPGG